MYQTPTTNDFQRKLADILAQTRDAAALDDQRIRAEHVSRGLIQSPPVVDAVAQRFDELHAAAVEQAMRLIDSFAVRGLNPIELGKSATPILETISEQLVARVVFTGNEALSLATEQARTVYPGSSRRDSTELCATSRSASSEERTSLYRLKTPTAGQ